MTDTLANLLTVLGTTIVSIGVAWGTSKHAIVVEAEKTRLTAQQRVLELLTERRLQVYPELYALLSSLPKMLDKVSAVSATLPETLRSVNQWDSQHSLVMSREASNCCHQFRMALVDAVHAGRTPGPQDHLTDLRKLAEDLESALRSDLGIHGIGMTPSKQRDLVVRSGSY